MKKEAIDTLEKDKKAMGENEQPKSSTVNRAASQSSSTALRIAYANKGTKGFFMKKKQ